MGGSRVCHFCLLRGSLFKQMGSNSCSTPVSSVTSAFLQVLNTYSDTFGQGHQSVRKPHDLATAVSLPDRNYTKLAKVKQLAHVATLLSCRGARMHVSEQLGSFIIPRHQQKLQGWVCKHASAFHSNSVTVQTSVLEIMLSVSLVQLPTYAFLVCTCSTVASEKTFLNDPSRLSIVLKHLSGHPPVDFLI